MDDYRKFYKRAKGQIFKTYKPYHCYDHQNAGFQDLDKGILDEKHIPKTSNETFVKQ
jgi:hypothetical protein